MDKNPLVSVSIEVGECWTVALVNYDDEAGSYFIMLQISSSVAPTPSKVLGRFEHLGCVKVKAKRQNSKHCYFLQWELSSDDAPEPESDLEQFVHETGHLLRTLHK